MSDEKPCVECHRPMVPRRAWDRLSAEDRAGKVCAQAHGRCCGRWHHTRPPRRRPASARRTGVGLDAATLARLRMDVGVPVAVEGGGPTP